MKEFLSKNKMLLILFMAIFFVLILTNKSNASSEKYVFIGDSRTYQMIGGAKNEYDYDYNKITSGRAQNSFAKKIIKSHAIVGAWYPTFFTNSNRLNNIKQTLNTAPEGTKVIVWLGVNDLANTYYYADGKLINTYGGTPALKAKEYVEQVKRLAKIYNKLNFYYISIGAVNENRSFNYYSRYLNNSRIDEFNTNLRKNIETLGLTNLHYVDINTQIKSKVVSTNTGDGLHYSTDLYKQISDLIYKEINGNTSEIVKNEETHILDFSRTKSVYKFYSTSYLKSDKNNKLRHIANSKATPMVLKSKQKIKFYTNKIYTLKVNNKIQRLYKVIINGRTGYINVNLLNSKFFI